METSPDEFRAAAAETLAALWGVPVSCAIEKTLRDRGRSRVWRLAVTGGPVESVILKASVGEAAHPYVVGDPTLEGAFRRLCNEWAGAAMLGPLRMGANGYAVDLKRGFCLLEDLGDGETLAERLTGNDPAAATSALFAYARSLGDLHAATKGQQSRWTSLLAEQGSGAGGDGPIATPWRLAAGAMPAFCRELEIEPPPSLGPELAAIARALDEAGAYFAFTPSDCCPDNHYLRGERVVFFDCEFAAVRHALLDASYFLAPFPSCWCCAALPDGLGERLLAAYRERFAGGADFDDQLTMALTAWLVSLVVARHNTVSNWVHTDVPWGLSTLRQRVMALIERLSARPNLATLAPGVAEVVAQLDLHLRARWPDFAPMATYPAFR
ncbi:MAG TPA: hypothetical protein VKT30_15275 [Caulobacteraceae bacterium]|nr:hypothetical protein [Caulobacteraceae bacterium]